jgi:autotransporter-associated beta strand protein
VGVGFQLRSWVQRRLRQSADALWLGMVLVAASLALTAAAQAQGFTWNGAAGIGNYLLGTNWTPTGGPPLVAGQSAVFDAAGSGTINATGGAILADSWTFNATSQSYAISGSDVHFSVAGAGGGIINNAGAGRTISISNNVGDGAGGAVQVQQLGSSTLILSGANTYSGGTLLSAGTLQITNSSSVGSGDVTLNGGTFQVQSGLGFLTFTNNFKINNTALGSAIDANGIALTIAGNITDGVGAGK